MSKRSCGLYKYFVTKRKLVEEDREGSNADSIESSTSSNDLTNEASSSFDLETVTSDSDSDIAIEDQDPPQEWLDSELSTNDRVSYSYNQFLILNVCNVDY